MDTRQFEERKKDHLRQALDPAHQTADLSGLSGVRLVHDPLPQLDLSHVSIEATCLEQPARTPFYISAMTAGHPGATQLNRTLARACEKRGWALGVGSQRRELDGTGSQTDIDGWGKLRTEFPALVAFSNLGLSQLPAISVRQALDLTSELKAAALVIHTNPLQEALQPEGTPRFKGTLDALDRLCRESKLPIVLKETGCGMSSEALLRIARLKLAAVDVAGLGGTHWGRIEGARASQDSLHARAAAAFANWGIPTVDSVISARQTLRPETQVWASGGVRTGVDAAKLLALGADLVGFAQPALKAALESPEALDTWMETREYELRVALFCTGCKTPLELRNLKPVQLKWG